ncbi:alpha/beta fold hydrolase [Georgenia sp. H159]|uniref:alpha/beta fold hydrolase n=1 Tax=Georgenia sp. H159 TaxID=3076115 RepID=UPI002D7927FF|nr:alpha/beta fold hydrolase [Georgenia sp. H159]
MPGITVEVWGAGERVVLVHGSLATGPSEWRCQRPLADEGYEVVVPTRRAYVHTSVGEDFLSDGADVAELLGDGAHLVGHSYGGLAALVAADLRPEAVRSLVLAEPPLFQVAADHPAVRRLELRLRAAFASRTGDREFLEHFLHVVGVPVDELSAALLDELVALVPALRRARQPWEARVPVDGLRTAPYPVVAVSGRHDEAFHAVCAALAHDHRAELRVIQGAGHEVQTVAEEFNAVLRDLWHGSRERAPDGVSGRCRLGHGSATGPSGTPAPG